MRFRDVEWLAQGHSASLQQGWDWIPSPCDSKARGPVTPFQGGEAHSANLTILFRSPLFSTAITHQGTKGTTEVQGCGSDFSPVIEWSPPASHRSPMHVCPSWAEEAWATPCPGLCRRPPCLAITHSPFQNPLQGSTTQQLHLLMLERPGCTSQPYSLPACKLLWH